MNLTQEMRKRLTPFLEDCIIVNEGHYMSDGFLSVPVINQSIKVLVEHAFYTPIELSRNILEICNTLIPVNYIESVII